ncbi:trans-aconitate 2-methyltransferase [Actinoplanes sp. N902-109]|uniref:class I SAM-dependent methyltransferase n=1 Tax=Actinoplanes sp. (strain N902-109) TaxID=649831 RepID=UPI000329450D|nr:class I SAM-dependent methyltransferase [Actinoplanes sp. N902-109]AGL16781.1 methyltransferase [Actinoplanes sp. N902-109]
MSQPGYAFSNTSEQAATHHDALGDLLDERTHATITELTELPGRRVLEVGAGAGSIAAWLAGPAAEVVATDIAPQRIPDRPRLTVRRHDIVTGAPLGRFDLVHARLLLGHLPQRAVALRNLTAALAPGGVLLTGDFTVAPGAFVMAAPDEQTAGLLSRYLPVHVRALTSHGYDNDWAHRAPSAFVSAGLTDVRFRSSATGWRGGGAGCRLLLAGLGQLRPALLVHGFTADDLTATAAALTDPRVLLNGFVFAQTSGRAPA